MKNLKVLVMIGSLIFVPLFGAGSESERQTQQLIGILGQKVYEKVKKDVANNPNPLKSIKQSAGYKLGEWIGYEQGFDNGEATLKKQPLKWENTFEQGKRQSMDSSDIYSLVENYYKYVGGGKPYQINDEFKEKFPNFAGTEFLVDRWGDAAFTFWFLRGYWKGYKEGFEDGKEPEDEGEDEGDEKPESEKPAESSAAAGAGAGE